MAIQKITGEDKQHAQLLQLLDAMENIRIAEQNGGGSPKQRDTYLGMSQELGELLISMPQIKSQLNNLKALFEKGEGKSYDPFFADVFRTTCPEMALGLEKLTIQLFGDDLTGFDDNHHIWNAVKYLSSRGKQKGEMLKIFDSIVPMQPARSYQGLDVDGKEPTKEILYVGRSPKGLIKLAARVGDAGFKTLRAEIDMNHPSDEERTMLGEVNSRVQADEAKKESRIIRFIEKNYNKVTWAPIYFVVGGLPKKVQEWVINKLKQNIYIRGDDTTLANIIGEGVISAGAAIACGLTLGPLACIPAAGYFGYTGIKGIVTAYKQYNDPVGLCCGNLFWKLPLLPFELKIRKEEKEEEDKTKKDWALIDFKLGGYHQKRSRNQDKHNLHPVMGSLGAVTVDASIEENLIHTPNNHNSQGYDFREALLAKTPQLEQCVLNREHDAVTSFNVLPVDIYSKISALVCFKGQRYAITMVTPSEFRPQDLPALLADSTKPIGKKLEGIAKSSNAIYAHVTQFDKCQKTADLVWRQG